EEREDREAKEELKANDMNLDKELLSIYCEQTQADDMSLYTTLNHGPPCHLSLDPTSQMASGKLGRLHPYLQTNPELVKVMNSDKNDFMPPECLDFYSLIRQLKPADKLEICFVNSPSAHPTVQYLRQSAYLNTSASFDFFRLDPQTSDSRQIIEAQEIGVQVIRKVRQKNRQLVQEICQNLDLIDKIKGLHWTWQQQNTPKEVAYSLTHFSQIPATCALLPLLHQVFGHLSQPRAQLIYDAYKMIASEALKVPMEERDSVIKAIEHLPVHVESLPRTFHIDPKNDEYIMCPTCFALYDRNTLCPIQQSPTSPVSFGLSNSQSRLGRDNSHLNEDTVMEDNLGSEFGDNEDEEAMDEEEQAQDNEEWAEAEEYVGGQPALAGLCTSQYTLSSIPCGTRLFKASKVDTAQSNTAEVTPQPLKIFLVPSLEEWLAKVLQEPGIEESIERFMRSRSHENAPINDILFSPYIQGLHDQNHEQFLFSDQSRLNLCLGLYLDWFGPRGNRMGASHYSTGILYFIILNLPPSIQYDRNYLFPIFIPGPREPSTTGLNHLLGPLISQLQTLFYKGISIRSHIYPSPVPREVRAMLSIIIADLLAACKIGGFASHAHRRFCRNCTIERSSMAENVNPTSWEPINRQAHLEAIRSWRDASSVDERKRIFDESGVRWTELAELQYLDLTKCFVIDPMHTVLLGVIANHIRRIFGLTERVEVNQATTTSTSAESPSFPQEEIRGNEILSRRWINSRLLDILSRFHSVTLEHLCQQRDLRFLSVPLWGGKAKKVDMVVALGQWVEQERPVHYIQDIDYGDTETILNSDVAEGVKRLELSLQPQPELYRACEDKGIDMSSLTYRLDYPSKREMIDLLLNESPPQRPSGSIIPLWRQMHRNRSRESVPTSQDIPDDDVSIPISDVLAFKTHSEEYLKGLQALFKSHRMKPNHHYLLHLGDMMGLKQMTYLHGQRVSTLLHQVDLGEFSELAMRHLKNQKISRDSTELATEIAEPSEWDLISPASFRLLVNFGQNQGRLFV
ncbi:16112_t:CDS:2, partial [Acaulospora colombiana]